MSTLIVLIFLVAFYDVIDKILLGVPPWIIIISTLIIYRVCRTVSSWRRWRKPFGSTYYQLISGKILRFLRKHVPFIRKQVTEELDKGSAQITEDKLRRLKGMSYLCELPEKGWDSQKIYDRIDTTIGLGDLKVEDGSVSGICHKLVSDKEHAEVVTKAMAAGAFVNPLNPEVFPGAAKLEAEVVRICCNLFHGDPKTSCGTMTSGGSDSIFLACKAYISLAREERGVKYPNIVLPVSGHVAIDKAAEVLGAQIRHVPIDLKSGTMQPDLKAYEAAIDKNTVLLYACAPTFPHGVMDPIQKIAKIAMKRNLPFHVDSCLGGFLLPFCDVPDLEPFDFRVKGVTSISADTHKYGYAPKGSSVILYCDKKYLHHQYFMSTDWSGGLCVFPTFAGSRVGSAITGTWAAMVRLGQSGYRSIAKEILETVRFLAHEIKGIPGLKVLGDPQLCIVAFTSEPEVHPYLIADEMGKRKWGLSRLQHPNCIHFYITPAHLKKGLKEKFIQDLREVTEQVLATGKGNKMEGVSAMYGMAQTIPDKTLSKELCHRYLDILYKTD